MSAIITISPEHLRELQEHLFLGDDEQAAFGYAEWVPAGTFRITELKLIPPEGFTFQSDYHIELASEVQAQVIKHAFDLGACVVEFHSHRTDQLARFSGSDFSGFAEFVPHVRWRLAGRPYAAVVFHESSFDGLAWVSTSPIQLDAIESSGTARQLATGLSVKRIGTHHVS